MGHPVITKDFPVKLLDIMGLLLKGFCLFYEMQRVKGNLRKRPQFIFLNQNKFYSLNQIKMKLDFER